MSNPKIKLLKHQLDFVLDTSTRFLGLVGGYGCGKTKAFCAKGIHLAQLNVGFKGALLEPTNAMVQDTLLPEFQEMLDEYEICHDFKASPYPTFTLHFETGSTILYMRSAENYRKLAGLNLAFFGVDEADTISPIIAHKMWKMLQSRIRIKGAPAIQGFTTSTPEGFGFLYEFFVKEVADAKKAGKIITNRRIIKARTYDNPFLDDEFIPSLLSTYSENEIKSYLEGEFTNLTSGTVYYAFDRKHSHTDLTLKDFPLHILHIGQDFNINKCSSIVHIVDQGITYALDELQGIRNTEEVIKEVLRKYPKREIIFYPDASGGSEKTNASTTDILLIKQAGFVVKCPAKNPDVRDRVNAMNARFLSADGKRRYFVNTDLCPTYTQCLEQQAYDKAGKPDKTHDTDHSNDASGYFVNWHWPIAKKATLRSY